MLTETRPLTLGARRRSIEIVFAEYSLSSLFSVLRFFDGLQIFDQVFGCDA
jgi:hypothetical protein